MAGTYDISTDQSGDLKITFLWKNTLGNPVDLHSFTAKMQVKVKEADTTSLLTLTTENGYILLYSDGHIVFNVPGTVTERVKPGIYVYSLVLHGPDYPNKVLLKGACTIEATATRP
jgi:hypothetical protein